MRRYNEGGSGQYLYSRYENPTVVAVEQKLAAADGAEQALVFSSGMAATSTILLALLEGGRRGGLRRRRSTAGRSTCSKISCRSSASSRGSSRVDEMREPERVMTDRTRVFWFESPNNPHLRCVDVKRIAEACRATERASASSTTRLPARINQRPLAMGVDLAMQSATKYLNGHSDVTAGVVCGSRRAGAAGGDGAAQAGRHPRSAAGIRAEPLAEDAGDSRRSVTTPTRWRSRRRSRVIPAIARVYYPGLGLTPGSRASPSARCPGLAAWCASTSTAAKRPHAARSIACRSSSGRRAWAATESLCSLPILTSQWGHTDEQLAAAGISKGMMRLSIGLEDPQDLIDDLEQALA